MPGDIDPVVAINKRRDALIDAAESAASHSLHLMVRALVDQGMTPERVLDDLYQIKDLVYEQYEDRVLDIMDLLVGYCYPSQRILPCDAPGRRDAMLKAVEEAAGYAQLRPFVAALAEQGMSPDILMDEMQSLLPLLTEEHEHMALEVMNQLAGYCPEARRFFPRPQPGDADYLMR